MDGSSLEAQSRGRLGKEVKYSSAALGSGRLTYLRVQINHSVVGWCYYTVIKYKSKWDGKTFMRLRLYEKFYVTLVYHHFLRAIIEITTLK